MAGIDIAVWDIKGKALGLAVYKLLGAARDRIAAQLAGGTGIPHWPAPGPGRPTRSTSSSKIRRILRCPADYLDDGQSETVGMRDSVSSHDVSRRSTLGRREDDAAPSLRSPSDFSSIAVIMWLADTVYSCDRRASPRVLAKTIDPPSGDQLGPQSTR